MDIYRKHRTLINTNPNKIYDTIVRSQLEPLDRQIKRLDIGQPTDNIFKDLHTNPNFTHKQKNIFYRLLFSITPTGYSQNMYCRLCNTHQETEEHIFYTCTKLNKLKVNLIKLLRQPINTDRELYNLIFLGLTTTNLGKDIKHYRQTLAQLYRDTIWEGRVDASLHRRNMSPNALSEHFLAKTNQYIQRSASRP